MSFAGKVWRLLVGIKDALALLFLLLFFGALFAILSVRPSPADIRDGALLLDLSGVIVEERTPVDPFEAFLSGSAPIKEYPARELRRAIDAAASDDRIKAVVLDLDLFLGGGQVHLQEVGEALGRVRAAGKPVLAYALSYSDDSYLLASYASEIWTDPMGGAIIAGAGGKRLYYGDFLDKVGINARVYKVGEFKSLGEPYERNSMSDEARRNEQALYSALWEEWLAAIKKARPSAQIEAYTADPVQWISDNGGDLAKTAKAAGLIDTIDSRFAFEARIAEIAGGSTSGDYAYAHTALDAWTAESKLGTTGSPIGIVTIAGPIVDGDAGPGTAGGTRIAQILDEALNSDLSGLVVRVDSPGGTVTASEQIRLAITRHKDKGIPIAVSMGNVAASGGYWVSMPADRIFAEPASVTGSIGVIAVVPTFEGLAEKLGVSTDGVSTTPLTGGFDFVSGFSPETDTIMQTVISSNYSRFITIVSEARSISRDRADELAQGRVWDGGAARQLGLIDQYGGLGDALRWVAKEAGNGEGDWYPVDLGWDDPQYGSFLMQLLGSDAEARAALDPVGLIAERNAQTLDAAVSDMSQLMAQPGARAVCLECPSQPRRPSRQTRLGSDGGLTLGTIMQVLGWR